MQTRGQIAGGLRLQGLGERQSDAISRTVKPADEYLRTIRMEPP
jgi:hypothetical protein